MEFFDIDSAPTENRMQNNGAKFNREKRFSLHYHKGEKIETVRLRGSWKTGEHQELLIKLASGVFVRISRTNGEDTFQIGAIEEGRSKSPMPQLLSYTPPRKLTCFDAFKAFADARKAAPRYEQADCHTFAQSIMVALIPASEPKLPALADDDFM